MYQSVGHQAVELYAEAMGLPLFRQRTNGVALQQEKIYTHTPEDEVEDLFDLLANIKVFILLHINIFYICFKIKFFLIQTQIEFDGVAVGAILSDYQRLRVEDV